MTDTPTELAWMEEALRLADEWRRYGNVADLSGCPYRKAFIAHLSRRPAGAAGLTDDEIDRIWHGMGSFWPNDHRYFARKVIEAAIERAVSAPPQAVERIEIGELLLPGVSYGNDEYDEPEILPTMKVLEQLQERLVHGDKDVSLEIFVELRSALAAPSAPAPVEPLAQADEREGTAGVLASSESKENDRG